jgi:tetratricopeptide (TPR) repeat protein
MVSRSREDAPPAILAPAAPEPAESPPALVPDPVCGTTSLLLADSAPAALEIDPAALAALSRTVVLGQTPAEPGPLDPASGSLVSPGNTASGVRASIQRPSSRDTHPGEAEATGSGEAPPDTPTVPGYEILEELGRGGMGVVYKARQLGLGRIVALKMILNAPYASPQDRERFRTEAEAIARLQHPQIVQIHEVGEYSGTLFFSLEFCPGGSLASRLAGTPRPALEAATLLELLARAMQSAHDVQVIHRDLKPENILLSADGTPRITDFGLARQLDQPGQTRSGDVVGTPSYMAPEQAHGQTRDIGPATDVYALAAILYEMLTGRPPFRAATVWDTLNQLCTEEPVPPRRLQPEIPRDLETICLKGLEKDPRRRYRSAQDLADDLQRFLHHEPIRARPVSAWERTWKWARRQPTAAGLVVALILTLMSLVAGSVSYGLYQDQQAAGLRRQLERRERVGGLVREAADAEGAGRLAQARKQTDEADRQFTRAASACDRALAMLDGEPGGSEDEAYAGLLDCRNRVRRYLEDRARGRQFHEQQSAFARDHREILLRDISFPGYDHLGNRRRILALAPAALARFQVKLPGPAEQAVRALEASREFCESSEQFNRIVLNCCEVLLVWAEAECPTGPGRSASERNAGTRRALELLDGVAALGRAFSLPPIQAFHTRRARYLALAGDEAGAQEEQERARQVPARTALDHFLVGLDAYGQGQLPRALESCAQALARQSTHFWAHYLQALCRIRLGRWAEAKSSLLVCVQLEPTLPWPRVLLAAAHGQLGEFAAAEEAFARALPELTDPADRYMALTNRSVLWIRRQKYDQALADLREALRLRPDAHHAWVNLAELHRQRKEYSQALTALNEALTRQPNDPALYYTRAWIHRAGKDLGAAQRDFERSIAEDSRADRAERPGLVGGTGREGRLVSALVEVGYLKHLAGKPTAALADFDTALRIDRDNPAAQRQRAETLLALKRYAEAGEALDRYLIRGKPDPDIFKARALIHSQLGEHSRALEMYNRVLWLKREEEVLVLRGWVFLRLQAAQLALADFDAALKQKSGLPTAFCGRAYARVALGYLEDAIRDAEEAVRQPLPSGEEGARLFFDAACVQARVAVLRRTSQAPGGRSAEAAARNEDRAVELVKEALRRLPAGERREFREQYIEKEPSLGPLRRRIGS